MIRSLTAVLALWLTANGIAMAQAPETAPTIVKLPGESSRFCFRDLDGDQHLDLVLIKRAGVQVSFQRADGSYPVKSDADLAWPSGKLGWDLADADGDGSTDLILLDENGDLKFHSIADRSFQPATPLLTGTRAFLPAGIRRLRCVRDVDGDGQADVVIPGTGRYRVFLTEVQNGERTFRTPIEVEFDANIDLGVGDPAELDSRFSSEVWLPWFDLRDVDGDGDADLLAETDDEVFFYLAEPGLPDRPTWILPLAERRRALEQGKRGIDFDDLLSNIAPTVSWRIEDLDGVV
ncbi:MAG: VCBS repeat-containing protein, partial [Planctomycetota bacterium]